MSDVVHGTTNVFIDLNLPGAEGRQTKTRLAMQIVEIVKARRLKQVEAARLLRVPQPQVSAVLNYHLDGFSIERLNELLTIASRSSAR